MDGVTIEMQLGEIRATGGHARFSLRLGEDGEVRLLVYALDPADSEKNVLLSLSKEEFCQLQEMVDKALEKSEQLRTFKANRPPDDSYGM